LESSSRQQPTQACLSPQFLSFVRFAASKASAAIVLSRKGSSSPMAASPAPCQSFSSHDFDEKTFKGLVEDSDARNALRLRRLRLPHANAWVSAALLPLTDLELFYVQPSFVLRIPVCSACRFPLAVSRALFACYLWIVWGIIPFAARSHEMSSRDTTGFATCCFVSLLRAFSTLRWRSHGSFSRRPGDVSIPFGAMSWSCH